VARQKIKTTAEVAEYPLNAAVYPVNRVDLGELIVTGIYPHLIDSRVFGTPLYYYLRKDKPGIIGFYPTPDQAYEIVIQGGE